MLVTLLVVSALLVAFANGANDNAKGVAPLVGSGFAELRAALRWGNATTLVGALAAVYVARYVNQDLVRAFGGGGLLPREFPVGGAYLGAVGLGAAATVLAATRLGIPVSTTHALTGALVGAGLVAVGPSRLAWGTLGAKFVVPLLLSPVLAGAATLVVYPALRAALGALGVARTVCVCVGDEVVPVTRQGHALALASTGRRLTVAEASQCETRYAGAVFTVPGRTVLRAAQYATSGAVSFARGLNDAPKIVGVMVAAGALAVAPSLGAVAGVMLLGGLLFTGRVATTMAGRITRMDGEQALAGSLVTAALVILASTMGLPVSTTHVSVGALIGIGVATRTAAWKTIGAIALAWVTTLPLAAALAAGTYAVLR